MFSRRLITFDARLLTFASFAMLTGFPPFQATSQDEIYRKAKSVEYDWPDSGTNSRRCHNDIPPEAKDLVASLLKVDAETRPSPDDVVSHRFFSMHGSNAMPLTLDPSCRRQKPVWLLDQAPRGDVMDSITPRLELESLARQCGVGHLDGDALPFNVVGENVDLSLYKECVAEEQAGISPVVPLPMDMVYTSTMSLKTWPNQRSPSPENPAASPLVNSQGNSIPRLPSIENLSQAKQLLQAPKIIQPRRAPIQSHAATLRAAQVGSMPTRAGLKSRPGIPHTQGSVRALDPQNHSRPHHPAGRLLNALPLRPNNSTTSSMGPRQAAAAAPRQPARVTRSAAARLPAVQGVKDNQASVSEDPEPDIKRRERSAKTEARIAATVQEEIEEAILGQRGSRRQKRTQPKRTSPKLTRPSVLIAPDEVAESLVGTKPGDVCSNLRRLRDYIARSLDPSSDQGKDLENSHVNGRKRANDRPVILKWVDYSHRFGIGYIFENGTVGCILNSDSENPPTCVVIAGAEEHLRKRKSPTYVDKHQIVPRDGAPVAFFEDCREEGIRRVLIPAKKYHMEGARAVSEEFRNSVDNYDKEKRERLYLWDKFARYMTQSLGKSDSAEFDSGSSEGDIPAIKVEPVGPFIRFYQRLGNIGIWGFGDGSFQFNFPDHTKLIISHDGTWLDFYHLSVHAAQTLKRGEMLETASLVERSVLRYPLSAMLSGSFQGHDFRRLIVENQLAEKLAFVRDVIGIWYEAGGLGCMGGRKDMRWEGMSERGGKLVWVTVGAWGGDERKYERPAI